MHWYCAAVKQLQELSPRYWADTLRQLGKVDSKSDDLAQAVTCFEHFQQVLFLAISCQCMLSAQMELSSLSPS